MSVEAWRPPDVEEVTPWQRARAGEWLVGRLETAAEALASMTGGRSVLADVQAGPAQSDDAAGPAAGPGARVGGELAEALVSAALGYDAAAPVDLASTPEQAVLALLTGVLRRWVENAIGAVGEGGAEEAGEVEVRVGCRCLGVEGAVAVAVAWPRLWAAVVRDLAAAAPKPTLPLDRLMGSVTAVVRGPVLGLAEVVPMAPGDVIALPAGAETRVALAMAGTPVAVGRLGAVRGRMAVQVEQVATGGSADG
jgi:hypothetical protein